MEAFGAFSDAEWDSFTAFFSSHELDHSLLPLPANAASTDLQPTDHGGSAFLNTSWFYSLDAFDPTLQTAIKQDMSCSSCTTDSSSTFVFANSTDMFMSMDDKSFGSSLFSDVLMEQVDKSLCAVDEDGRRERFENVQDCHPLPQVAASGKKLIPSKRKQEEPKPVTEGGGKVNNSAFSDNQKKKTNKKSTRQWKKSRNTRGVSVEEEGDGQSSISCSSEEENENGSQEGNGVSTTTSDGKRRASRGSATDPQSLYARKRRERINERLKMLQRLVPNGTKVDISTMLEEAVQYVKFLQVQIKLLSSDEMWMFAPLAYNGMDIGLHHHQRLSPFLSN